MIRPQDQWLPFPLIHPLAYSLTGTGLKHFIFRLPDNVLDVFRNICLLIPRTSYQEDL